MQKVLLIGILFLIPLAYPEEHSWNFAHHGSDWTGECATGKDQSPIAIQTATLDTMQTGVTMNYMYSVGSSADLAFNGHYVIANIGENRGFVKFLNMLSAKLVGELVNYHFHTPSEHTVNGKQYAMEMHMVHKIIDSPNEDQFKYIVLAIFFDDTTSQTNNSFIADLLIPQITSEVDVTPKVNLDALIESLSPSVYYYDGSLTTPPCSEVVHWVIFTDPLAVNSTQITPFELLNNNTYRATQPVNGRDIYLVDKLTKQYNGNRRNYTGGILPTIIFVGGIAIIAVYLILLLLHYFNIL